jgi:hypothetical protein
MKTKTVSPCYWFIEAEGGAFTVIGGPLRLDEKDRRYVWVTSPNGQKRVLRVPRASIRISSQKEYAQRLAADLRAETDGKANAGLN